MARTPPTSWSLPPVSVPSWLAYAVAWVAPILAALGDPSARARHVALGLTSAGDRSGAAPMAQILVAPLTLLPFGDLDHRAALALSIPTAFAAYFVAKRAARYPWTGGVVAASLIVFAVGALAATLLSFVDPSASLAAIAIELSLLAVVGKTARANAIALVATVIAAWASPRLALAPLVPLVFALRRGAFSRPLALAIALPPLGVLAAFVLLRGAYASFAIGRLLESPAFAADPAPFGVAAVVRAGIVAGGLALLAFVVAGKLLPTEDRLSAVVAAIAVVLVFAVEPYGALAVAILAVLPTVAAALGAVHLAVDRAIVDRAKAHFRVLAWIIPALALGWTARAIEDDLRLTRLPSDAAAARDFVSIATLGVAPAHPVYAIDEESDLVDFAHARASYGLRPDLRLLPTRWLLVGGPARIAARTIDAIPQAATFVNALAARDEVEEADVSPLAQRYALFAALSWTRLRPVARHVESTGGPLLLPLERVDPSDRRIHRVLLDRRLHLFLASVTSIPTDDPVLASLRIAATREARLLSLVDHEGALAALGRALSLGADQARITRWAQKIRARQSLADEPWTVDD